MLPEDRKPGQEHYRANINVVDRQLDKAGARLASGRSEPMRTHAGSPPFPNTLTLCKMKMRVVSSGKFR